MVAGFSIIITNNKDAFAPNVILVLLTGRRHFPLHTLGFCSGSNTQRRIVTRTYGIVLGRGTPSVTFDCAASPRITFDSISFIVTRVHINGCPVHRLSRGVPLHRNIINRRAYKPNKVTCNVHSVNNILRLISCVRGCSPGT